MTRDPDFAWPQLDTPRYRLAATDFDALDGLAGDDHLAAWRVFLLSARSIAAAEPPLRSGLAASDAFRQFCATLAAQPEPGSDAEAAQRILANFRPYRIEPADPAERGFLTGYYEPVVEGSLTRAPGFEAPILSRPAGFDHSGPGVAAEPGPSRRVIETEAEAGRYPPVLWLRDWVEVFLLQVQGSGRVDLPDGSSLRLVYDGRNGRPYTSIGRILVETGEIPLGEMSLDRLKDWIRRNGQAAGEAGRSLMWRNESYIFFRTAPPAPGTGPTGGQGLPLTALRSIAVDRTLWPYGLPFFIEADLPWRGAAVEPFRRLMIAQDTGSAILGPARADLFFGSGPEAGRLAGGIRHAARFTVLLPRWGEAALIAEPPR